MSDLSERMAVDGYHALASPMPEMMVRALSVVFDDVNPGSSGQVADFEARNIGGGSVGGGRRLAAANDNADCPVEAVLQFLRNFTPLTQALKAILGPHAVAVRMLFFNEQQATNQDLAWHQDVTITARNANPLPPGFGPANVTAGIAHITAPPEFLANLLTARIYLDDAKAENGLFEISPGSHRRGRIPRNVLAMTPEIEPAKAWPARRGDIHLYRPLLLHRTRSPQDGGQCRVIQIEMAPLRDLPGSLQWHCATPLY